MALVKSGTFGSSPSAQYEIHAQQTSGSGTKRTIKITMKLKVKGGSSSRYGYPLNWKGKIGSSTSGWTKVKGNETWYGTDSFRSYHWTATVDVGTTSSKAISVGFQLDMTAGSSSWETTQTGNFTTGATLTAPPTPGSLKVSGGYEVGKTQTLTWSASSTATNYERQHRVYDMVKKEWLSWTSSGNTGNVTSISWTPEQKVLGDMNRGGIQWRVKAINAAGSSGWRESNVSEHWGIRVWNGSAWVWGQQRVWNGSAWVKSVPRIWRNGAWRYS